MNKRMDSILTVSMCLPDVRLGCGSICRPRPEPHTGVNPVYRRRETVERRSARSGLLVPIREDNLGA